MTGYARYRSTNTQLCGPRQILLRLFERLCMDLQLAVSQLEAGQQACFHRPREILLELLGALDHDSAPELTAQLGGIYQWALTELVAAGRDQSLEKTQAVLNVTKTLYEGWQFAVSNAPRNVA